MRTLTTAALLLLLLASSLLALAFIATRAPLGRGRTIAAVSNAVASAKRPASLDATQHASRFGALPLSFEPNRGQTDQRVSFLAHGSGFTLFLTGSDMELALGGSAAFRAPHSRLSHARATARNQSLDTRNWKPRTAVSLHFLGASSHPPTFARDRLPGMVNYLIGANPGAWHTNIPTFARVVARDIYPGVDLVYYGRESRLEYDLVLRPGAQLQAIRLQMRGADGMRLDRHGNLVLDRGLLMQGRPAIYQIVHGKRQRIAGRYILQGRNRVGFQVRHYDHALPLIIDPTLTYFEFVAGSEGHGVTVDSGGNAYLTGYAFSTDFPVTTGAYQRTPGGSNDAFVSKLDPTGTYLIYSTYVGGSNDDEANGIAVDSSGNAYITGHTIGGGFPTTSNAFQRVSNGDNAFVTKLNAAGSALLYSTYLTGDGFDQGNAIAVDGSGAVYITGETLSTDYPTTGNAYQRTSVLGQCYDEVGNPQPCPDAFVSKLNPSASGAGSLVYSTYLGGDYEDYGNGIAVDTSGNIYVTGKTDSTDFPDTAGALQGCCAGGFVAKLNPSHTGAGSLVYSTYIGGTYDDYGNSIAVDSAGDVYVTGYVQSTTFVTCPGASSECATTGNALQPTTGGDGDAFVSKLNATGNKLIYSTYLGGNGTNPYTYGALDEGKGIAVDSSGNAYITGNATSTNFPTCPGSDSRCATTGTAIQGSLGGQQDSFVAEVNAAGSKLTYSTYLGGRSDDYGQSIAVNSAGAAYIGGFTYSTGANGTQGLEESYMGEISQSAPTVAHITDLTTQQLKAGIVFRWRMATRAGVVGFNLYAGDHRLNTALIRPHAGRAYRYWVQRLRGGPFTLRVLLSGGRQIAVGGG